jgi:hypothetical protein
MIAKSVELVVMSNLCSIVENAKLFFVLEEKESKIAGGDFTTFNTFN